MINKDVKKNKAFFLARNAASEQKLVWRYANSFHAALLRGSLALAYYRLDHLHGDYALVVSSTYGFRFKYARFPYCFN